MTTRVGITKATARIALLCTVFALAACGGGKKSEPGPNPPNPPTNPTYTISGTVSGLSGTGLVLTNNGANNLSVSANGTFQFTTSLTSGAAYAVAVTTQPSAPTQVCTVTNGSGTVLSANVTNVVVNCVGITFTVGGSVTGLGGTGLVLQNNAGDNLPITSNGAFVFNAALANNSTYAVTVLTQPSAPIQRCSVSNGSGTNASGNVSNIAIACADVVPRFVWSVNANAGTISTFRVDAATGELRSAGYNKVGTSPIGFRTVPSPANSNLGFVYTLNQGSMDITASLTDRTTNAFGGSIAGSPFSVGTQPSGFTTHRNNRFMYVIHGAAGNVSAYSINDTTGVLTPIAGSPFAAGTLPISLSFDPTGQFAYVVNQSSANIYTYSINSTTGALTEIVANRISTGTTPQGLIVPPGSNFAFVANFNSNSISVFAINSTTGALTHVTGSPFVTSANPDNLRFHPNGRYLYLSSAGAASISGYAINSTSGALTQLAGSPYATGPIPVGMVFDATLRFIYLTSAQTSTINAFSIDSGTGVLTSAGTLSTAAPVGGLIPEASGKYLYALSNSVDAIYSFHINQTTGALSPFTTTPTIASGRLPIFGFSALPSTTPITVIPKHVYLANDAGTGNGNVVSYSVNAATGALTSLGTLIASGVEPSGMATTPNGKYVYVANYGSNTLSAYESTNGQLTTVPGSPFASPAGPHFVSVDGGGRFAYVAHDNTISTYAINGNTGALTQVGIPIAAGSGLETLVADNNGRCVFATNNGSNTVSAYAVNSLTGALTPAVGSPFASGPSPIDITMHPSGRFVYVTNDGNNTVSTYGITAGFSNNCVLTPIAGSPTSAGSAAFGLISIAAEPSGKFVYAGNEVSDTVSIFSVNQLTGALTLTGTPAAIGSGVTADPSGKFLYVAANSGITDNLVTYNINPTTGALTPAVGTPVNVTNVTAGTITGELQL